MLDAKQCKPFLQGFEPGLFSLPWTIYYVFELVCCNVYYTFHHNYIHPLWISTGGWPVQNCMVTNLCVFLCYYALTHKANLPKAVMPRLSTVYRLCLHTRNRDNSIEIVVPSVRAIGLVSSSHQPLAHII